MAARTTRRERMRRTLARWRRSGLSAAAFCRREGLVPQTLSYWKRALGGAVPVVKRRRTPGQVDFVPVRLVDRAAEGMAASGLEIVLASGDRVVVGASVSRDLLREALSTLRERC